MPESRIEGACRPSRRNESHPKLDEQAHEKLLTRIEAVGRKG